MSTRAIFLTAYRVACLRLKIIDVDNDANNDNNKEDLIPLVLLRQGLNLPASMKLEELFNYVENFFCPLNYKKNPKNNRCLKKLIQGH